MLFIHTSRVIKKMSVVKNLVSLDLLGVRAVIGDK